MKKKQKIKLLPHEVELVKQGHLVDVTHLNASSQWLSAKSRIVPKADQVLWVIDTWVISNATIFYNKINCQIPSPIKLLPKEL